MAGGAKPSGPTGKRQQMLGPAARAPDPGKSAAGIAAVKIAQDHVFDDRPEITIVPLEAAFVFGYEPLDMIKKHSIENGAFRMTRTVNSRNIGISENSGFCRLITFFLKV